MLDINKIVDGSVETVSLDKTGEFVTMILEHLKIKEYDNTKKRIFIIKFEDKEYLYDDELLEQIINAIKRAYRKRHINSTNINEVAFIFEYDVKKGVASDFFVVDNSAFVGQDEIYRLINTEKIIELI